MLQKKTTPKRLASYKTLLTKNCKIHWPIRVCRLFWALFYVDWFLIMWYSWILLCIILRIQCWSCDGNPEWLLPTLAICRQYEDFQTFERYVFRASKMIKTIGLEGDIWRSNKFHTIFSILITKEFRGLWYWNFLILIEKTFFSCIRIIQMLQWPTMLTN